MSTENTVEVQIRANIAQYQTAMKDAGSLTTETSKQMREGLGDLGREAQAAQAPVMDLGKSIRDFASEERQQGRLGTFLATQIGQLGIASKGAAHDVAALVSAFAFGGGIGVGVELVKLTAAAFNELGAEEAKAREELTKYADETKKQVEQLHIQIQGMLLDIGGATKAQKLAHQTLAQDLLEQKKLTEDLERTRSNLTEANKEGYGVDETAAAAHAAYVAQLTSEIGRLEAQLKEVDRRIGEKKGEIAPAQAGYNKEDLQKAAEDAAKFRAAELQEQKKHYDAVTVVTLKAMEDQERFELQVSKVTEEAEKKKFELKQHLTEAGAKDAERIAKEQDKAAKTQIAMAQQLGSAMGDAFAGMISGTKSVAKAFADMAIVMLRAILDVAIKSITASALKAGAEAASSQAGVPLIGPVLAVAAMTAMIGTVMGLLAALPSASSGLDIPSGFSGAMPIGVHAGESVIQSQTNSGLREFLDAWRSGDMGGGGDVHLHFHGLTDADGARRFIERPDVLRAVQEAVRNGKWPTP